MKIFISVFYAQLQISEDYTGKYVKIDGQIRSYNYYDGKHNRLKLFVFVRELELIKKEHVIFTNRLCFDGHLCKKPVYRKTPLGREITDILLAVNRPYGKSDYIPCICWGRNAQFAAGFEVGSLITIQGRFQSRDYIKRVGSCRAEKRIDYEVSISRIV